MKTMNFEDASFASPLAPYRGDYSSNGNTIDGVVRRDPTATEHIQASGIIGLNQNICGGYSVGEPYRLQIISGHPNAKDCAVRNKVGMANISSLGITQTGQNSIPSTHGVSKRFRTTFSVSQLNRLESEFRLSMYVIGLKRMKLAEELHLEEKQVKIWFQNRRMKHKREQKKNERKTKQLPFYYRYQ